MNSPIFSVIIPIYNRESTIKECIDSIICQNYANYELLLVDDGSTDNSQKICQEYVKDNSNIHYYYKENGGLSDARNFGLQYANGSHIIFLDSDDLLGITSLESFSKIINEYDPDVISYEFCFDKSELEKTCIELNQDNIKKLPVKEYFRENIAVTNKVFKKDCIVNLRFVYGQISEDILFLFRVYEKANLIYKMSEKFYFYRKSEGSITTSPLSLSDRTSLDGISEVNKTCKEKYQEMEDDSTVLYCRAMFNLINKAALRGFSDEECKRYYQNTRI